MLGIAFGTRPEWLKIKPVAEELKKRNIPFGLIFTGQHEDLIDENAAMRMGAKTFHRTCIDQLSNYRLNSIVSSLLLDDFIFDGITKIMVQGDTSSAFAVALSAFHRQIPVIHLEAGLRTHNLEQPYPEEANRQMISCITSLHLCPTQIAFDCLMQEGKLLKQKHAVTGNTALDNLRDVVVTPENKILVTMHRRENHSRMWEWFFAIDELAKVYSQYEFVLPIHPNPAVSKFRNHFEHVKVVDPMSHDELIDYLSKCSYVITDSGGIQEEAAFLRVPCVVCRKETERTEGLGNFSILCKVPENLSHAIVWLDALKVEGPCPYGDGYAAEKVVDAIQRF